IHDLAAALTLVAGLQFITRLDGPTLAMLTGVFQLQVQIGLGAKDCLLKADVDAGLDVAAAGFARLAALLAAETAAEETAEDVAQAQVAEIEVDVLSLAAETAAERIATACAADAGVAELVVALALLTVLQNLVGFVDFFEFALVAAAVRMILDRGLPERLFDLVGRGVLLHS